MTVLCSDKTGTLTKNILTIDEPELIDCTDPEDIIFKAALGAKAVDPDAIDKCVRDAVRDPSRFKDYKELDFLPFDPVIKRTEATVEGPEGTFKVTKGAPQVILAMAHNKDEIKERVDQAVINFAGMGLRPVGVAWDPENNGKWIFLGLISLFDPPRDDTKEVIEAALSLGASVKMITGDHLVC
jgi:H+-transporting ATPase